MAQIETVCYINKVKQIGTGTVLECAERHSKKNPQTGQYEPDGTVTYYDVWADNAEMEHGAMAENNLVRITGSFKTKVTEKDGRKFYTNVIQAKTIAFAKAGGSAKAAPVASEPVLPSTWVEKPAADVEAPF